MEPRQGFWDWFLCVSERERALEQRALKAEARVEILEVQLEQMGEVNESLRSWLLASTAAAASVTNTINPPDPRAKFRNQA